MQMNEFHSIPSLFLDMCRANDFPGWYRRVNGSWEAYSGKRLEEMLFYASLAFSKHGVGEGKSLGIIACTSPNWIVADLACEVCHAPTVPLFPNISEEHFLFQCEDSEIGFLAVDNVENLDAGIRKHLARFRYVICFDENAKLPINGIYWKSLLTEGEILSREYGTKEWFKYRIDTIKRSHLFSVIYTSGSTGRPKGVELSHRNMLSMVAALDGMIDPKPETDSAMTLLPVAHVFERMVICFYMRKHLKLYFADSPKNAGVIAHEVRPTIGTFVPRILERLAEAIASREYKLSGAKRLLMHRAVLFAKKTVPGCSPIRHAFYDKLIYAKIREALGGRYKWIISGSSALNKTVYRFLVNIGFPIYEGYGLTECSPVISSNVPSANKIGSVGKPLKSLEVKIGEQHEILVKGMSVFQGYRNMPEMNRAAWTEDGFFRTGDQGYLDKEGFLFLTGRIKEIFKTSTGKYVSPVPIELELVRHPLIEAAMIVANNRKFVSALIFLGYDEAMRVLGKNRKDFDPEAAIQNPEILNVVQSHVDTVNRKLNRWEQIKKWTLVSDPLSVESGLLTPTFKLRRGPVETRFHHRIEKMYIE
ncbi:MAG: AMP-binding protein [Fibrobacter sp.]|nr:AMP-binding protein [Fibrobacter sp.]